MRDRVTLACEECKNRNYTTTKNKKTTTGRIELQNIVSSAKSTLITRKQGRNK